MKIFYINNFLNEYHGAAIHGRKLISALEKLGIKIITYPSIIFENELVFKNKIKDKLRNMFPLWIQEIFIYFKRKIIRRIEIKKIVKIVQKEKPDCILVRPSLCDEVSLLIKKNTPIPIILEVNHPQYIEFFKHEKYRSAFNLIKNVEIKTWNNAEAVYVVSNVLKEIIKMNIENKDKKIWVIPNGVDFDAFKDINLGFHFKKKGIKEVSIGFIGSFHDYHDIDFLINIFIEVLNQRPNIKLILIGDGQYKDLVIKKVRDSNVPKDKIILYGRLIYSDMVSKLINDIDICVAPFRCYKKFYFSPLKIFDYMAAGKAIITTELGQIKEILTDGINAKLVKPGDDFGFISALIDLIDSHKVRTSLGYNARERVKDFTWHKVANRLHNHFNTLI